MEKLDVGSLVHRIANTEHIELKPLETCVLLLSGSKQLLHGFPLYVHQEHGDKSKPSERPSGQSRGQEVKRIAGRFNRSQELLIETKREIVTSQSSKRIRTTKNE